MILSYLLYSILAFFVFFSIINLLTSVYSFKKERKHSGYFPMVSVVVRTWNDGNVVERCIQNYLRQSYPNSNYEIIIVDDGSTDETKEICEKYSKKGKIKYIRLEKHQKYKAKVIDYVIKNYSVGEIIVETDVDAVLREDFIETIVNPYYDSNVAAVTGVVMCGNWYRNFLTKIRAIENFWWFCISMYGRFKLTGQGFLYGGCKSYRKSVWEDVGGHPTKTLVEDAEFAAKLIDKGYKIAITKSSPIVQEEVETMKQYFSEQRRWISGDLDVTMKYKKELSKDTLSQFVMYSNFSVDFLYLFSIIFSFIQPLFLVPILVNLVSLWIGLFNFNAKSIFYLYSFAYVLLSPLLHFLVLLSILRSKISGKKVDWTKVWHYPTKLTWPTNK